MLNFLKFGRTGFIAALGEIALIVIGILLALPAAAVLSVIVRFAYQRYLAAHPDAARIAEAEAGDD